MAFEKIDQVAAEANRNVSTAFARRCSGNARDARVKRQRCGTVSVSFQDPLVCCGAFSSIADGQREWQALPFIWRCGDPDTETVVINIDQDHQTATLEMEWGCAATALRTFPSAPPPTFTTTVTATGEAYVTLSCDVAGIHNGDYFVLWVYFKSEMASTPFATTNGEYEGWQHLYENFDKPNPIFATTSVPTFALAYTADVNGKASSWAGTGAVPAPRQVLRTMEYTSSMQALVWPPTATRLDLDDDIDPGSQEVSAFNLAWAKLYSVNILDVPPSYPDIGAQFNAGQVMATAAFRQIYGDAERVFLRQTRSHAIGSWPTGTLPDMVDPDLDLVDPWMPHVELDTDWKTIGSTTIGDGDVFLPLSGASEQVRNVTRVTAMVGVTRPVSASGRRDPDSDWEEPAIVNSFKFRLRVYSPGGGSETLSGELDIGQNPMQFNYSPLIGRGNSSPAGTLLHWPWGDESDGNLAPNTRILTRHALRGGLPRDVWSTCKSMFVQLEIQDDDFPEGFRQLDLEVTTGENFSLGSEQLHRVHLLCWHVEEQPSNSAEAVTG